MSPLVDRDRIRSRHTDGTAIFTTDRDRRNQAAVAAILAVAWRCEIRAFAELAALDFYAVRHERVIGVAELKCREIASNDYPTVFLSTRKWLALLLASIGHGVPGVFVVRFTDEIRWIRIELIMGRVTIGGSRSEQEPVIEVPVDQMRRVRA